MPEQKKKNIIIATTVTGVLLLVILLSILIFQLVSISNKNNEMADLDEQIALYEQMIAERRDDIDICTQRWWIEMSARELGYRYNTDIQLP